MAATYEKDNEWGGFIIELDSGGFLLRYHVHNDEELNGLNVLVPYGTWGFFRGTDLEAPRDEVLSNGEALATLALDDAKRSVESRQVTVLSEGMPLEGRKQKGAVDRPPRAPHPPRVPHRRWWLKLRREEVPQRKEIRFSWYTFSAQKSDELQYGNCHDLFSTMFLRYGLPHGMALWMKSKLATDENVFFVQIPETVQVQEDRFFTVFPLQECAPPSKVALYFLAGDRS